MNIFNLEVNLKKMIWLRHHLYGFNDINLFSSVHIVGVKTTRITNNEWRNNLIPLTSVDTDYPFILFWDLKHCWH